ncbi:CLUMA_CG009741, isoform A [Clunio marinus]|uniref:CLUMA_CG009741, isoform A n=1 Tax=Clunio marinus TaxID=568069 RepID=A0A1J1I9B2_9DIPT|nr:CLUMA_CG009741, isoform A [Clunio marinus]
MSWLSELQKLTCRNAQESRSVKKTLRSRLRNTREFHLTAVNCDDNKSTKKSCWMFPILNTQLLFCLVFYTVYAHRNKIGRNFALLDFMIALTFTCSQKTKDGSHMFMKNKRTSEPVKHGKQDIVLSRSGITATAALTTSQKEWDPLKRSKAKGYRMKAIFKIRKKS